MIVRVEPTTGRQKGKRLFVISLDVYDQLRRIKEIAFGARTFPDSLGLPGMSEESLYNSTFQPCASDFLLNACLGYSHSEWGTIACGFQDAANHLVAHLQTRESDLDTMIYPIAFLYRHAIETTLKIAIITTGVAKVPPSNHGLLEAWDRMKQVVGERFEADPDYVDMTFIRSVLADFESIDPLSTAFRYPTRKNGSAQLNGINVVNVDTLANRANRLLELLDRVINAYA